MAALLINLLVSIVTLSMAEFRPETANDDCTNATPISKCLQLNGSAEYSYIKQFDLNSEMEVVNTEHSYIFSSGSYYYFQQCVGLGTMKVSLYDNSKRLIAQAESKDILFQCKSTDIYYVNIEPAIAEDSTANACGSVILYLKNFQE